MRTLVWRRVKSILIRNLIRPKIGYSVVLSSRKQITLLSQTESILLIVHVLRCHLVGNTLSKVQFFRFVGLWPWEGSSEVLHHALLEWLILAALIWVWSCFHGLRRVNSRPHLIHLSVQRLVALGGSRNDYVGWIGGCCKLCLSLWNGMDWSGLLLLARRLAFDFSEELSVLWG